uniref:BPTI/Kunitz inhibitor domain-containing protein n=1 Tax=Plectus sambesii TaxID=2011161 RepID=A0A914VMQ5_9BILA
MASATRAAPLPLLLLLLLLTTQVVQCMINYGREGDACNRVDSNWYAVPESSEHFIYCHPKHGVYVRDRCAIIDGRRKTFDAVLQQCVFPRDVGEEPMMSNQIRTAGSNAVRCQTSEDCPSSKWVCGERGKCECQSAFVQVGTQCWPKIEIGQGECSFDKQCTSIWSTARCVKKICQCPFNSVVVKTSNGLACTKRSECPVGGREAILPGSENCHIKGGCSPMDKALALSHYFDCIQGDGYIGSVCCPNKAYTCMQPVMPGDGPLRALRYYYNPVTDECSSFMFHSGTQINSNVFESKLQCETYCRSGCPRGLPQLHEDREISCVSGGDCDEQYDCFKRDNFSVGLCCPSQGKKIYRLSQNFIHKPFICSAKGGRVNGDIREGEDEFDAGTMPRHSTSVYYPVIRYYFSTKHASCKAFLYQGEGGNFNQFLTLEHCRNFCQAVVCKNSKAKRGSDGLFIECNTTNDCPVEHLCTQGICCETTEPECRNGNLPYMTSNGTHRVPLRCSATTHCPAPYACDFETNIIGAGSSGYCCSYEPKSLKPKFSTVERTSEPFSTDEPPMEQLPSTPPTTRETTTSAKTTVAVITAAATTATTTATTTTTTAAPTSTKAPTIIISTTSTPATTPTTPLTTTSTVPTTTSIELPAQFCLGDRSSLVNEHGRPVLCYLGSDSGLLSEPGCGGSAGHICSFLSINMSVGACCSALDPNQYRCPAGMVPLRTPYTGRRAKPCSPMHLDSCPGPASVCVFDELYGTYHCCQTPTDNIAGVGCPLGQGSFNDPLTNETLECNPIKLNTCPPGFGCHFSTLHGRYQCCGASSSCPMNSATYLSPVTGESISCDRTHGCPQAFFCYFDTQRGTQQGTCCSEDPIISLCDQGTALRTTEGRGVKCDQLNNKCPAGYSCLTRFNISICCPHPQNICTQPKHDGLLCTEAPEQTRFFYDTMQRTCKSFVFSGCSGNDNRFETQSDCATFCNVAEMVCSLPHDSGTKCSSGDAGQAWYFNPSAAACLPFEYHGCAGSLNRFGTQQECAESCFESLCPVGQPKMDDGRLIACSIDAQCDNGYNCVSPRYGGDNITICCPQPEALCNLPADPGSPCGTPHLRYRFDHIINGCKHYLYYGCGGSQNSFLTEAHCQAFCSPDPQCRSGKQPYIDPDLQTIKKCLPGHFGFFDGCPDDYACQMTSEGRYFCCPEATVDEACVVGSQPFVHTLTDRPVGCAQEYGNCPFGYQCVYNHKFGESFCCTEHEQVTAEPPAAELPPLNTTGIPTIQAFASDLCADGSEPFYDEYSKNFRICNPYLTFSCPEDFQCEFNHVAGRYHCCRTNELGMISDAKHACPTGLFPFPHPRTNQPIVCQPGIAGFCPYSSLCQYSPLYWQFICCAKREITYNALMAATRQHEALVRAESALAKRFFPGEAGCVNDEQCSATFNNARCHDWICVCPHAMKVFEKSCVFKCPQGYEDYERRCAKVYDKSTGKN